MVRRVDAMKPDTLAGNFECVAVDHTGRAGHVRQSYGRQQGD